MKNNYIYLIWFVALLPIILLRDFTPNNELRYLNIVDEALQNGTFFTFTNQGEIYADKPPLHFWLMMLGKWVLGEHQMWYYALLSIIPAFVILVTLTKWIREVNENILTGDNEMTDQQGEKQMTIPLMLMIAGFFIGVTLVIRMDMLMNMFIVLSLYSFYKMFQGKGSKQDKWLFPLYVFMALFSKGPLGILIPFVSTTLFLLYRKRVSDFSTYWGWKSLLIILSGCIIWFAGAYIEGGNDYLNNLLVYQTVGRGINSFHHKEPFYYYAISLWYTLAPWSFLTIGVVVVGIVRKKLTSTLEQFFATIILSTLVLLSLISSKLGIYSLPVIPFFIALSVLLLRKFNPQNRWIKTSLAIPTIALIFSLPAIIYLCSTEEMKYLVNPFVYAGAGVLTITGLVVLYFLYLKKRTYWAIHSLTFGFLAAIFLLGLSIPQLNSRIGWGNLCEKAIELSEEYEIADYCVYNIKRAENMDVYLGKDILKIEKEDIVNEFLTHKLVMLRLKDIKNDPDIRAAVLNRVQYQVGNHAIVIF